MRNRRQLVRPEEPLQYSCSFSMLALWSFAHRAPRCPSPSCSLPEPSERTGFCRTTVQPRSPPLTGLSQCPPAPPLPCDVALSEVGFPQKKNLRAGSLFERCSQAGAGRAWRSETGKGRKPTWRPPLWETVGNCGRAPWGTLRGLTPAVILHA